MDHHLENLSVESCRKARLSKDPRFDGQFFVGVITTGIFCRPICPAVSPQEKNVRYFDSAIRAVNAGLRPCLRCRPDSAPDSFAWKGTQTTIERALRLIDAGVMSGDNGLSIEALSERLGIGSRYLRQLFNKHLGTSPKQYAQFRQLMFAKQLLHQTDLPVVQVGLAAGYTSIRRFNEVFKDTLQLTPTELRKKRSNTQPLAVNDNGSGRGLSLSLQLSYRPPLNWSHLSEFYQLRMVDGMEWLNDLSYGRTFQLGSAKGFFEAVHHPEKNRFKVTIHLSDTQDIVQLKDIVMQIRRLLDLDADMNKIQSSLASISLISNQIKEGLRLPGTWSAFEAGCRAILGQQVSVTQATKLLNCMVKANGEELSLSGRTLRMFPTPDKLAKANLDELKMPGARKAAINAFSLYVATNPDADLDEWLTIKGIGPWTVAYAKMRGLSDPNILLCTDLIVKKKVLKMYELDRLSVDAAETGKPVNYGALTESLRQQATPWGSYLTFQLWNLT
ncbi:transcriptional regulator, AraC family [Shewanella sediminis HAW-EB3]|uniref:Transcriptional regulator, AraC family n=1 Tax=Shewanella sediminis (strain HAW-EB3) TaxID=425104 RepID=A8FXD8_SHESH|nr:AlkA N-terminal domain-containing protein [Shewanella sediminis]ABV37511.1 transcriptional regulator, AraC family [Shewanella sediminis HAW-EB3]